MKLVIEFDGTPGKPGILQSSQYGKFEMEYFSRNQVVQLIKYEMVGSNHIQATTSQKYVGRTIHYFYAPHVRVEGTEELNNPTESREREQALRNTAIHQDKRDEDRGEVIYLPGYGKRYLNDPIDGCKNFFWYEALHNGSRIPTEKYEVDNIIDVAKTLQYVKDNYLDGESMIITSWLRNGGSNARVGGSSLSTHVSGSGVDWYCPNLSEEEVFRRLDPHWSYGLAIRPGAFIHTDRGKDARNRLMSFRRRWSY